jgi:hypothetical protein
MSASAYGDSDVDRRSRGVDRSIPLREIHAYGEGGMREGEVPE